jgi:exodeoxyribonuclease VII small subunit
MARKTFEQALAALEVIVQELEDGDLPLEKALQKFEEGIALSRFCAARLDETEKKITLLTQAADGSVREIPGDLDGEDAGGDT